MLTDRQTDRQQQQHSLQDVRTGDRSLAAAEIIFFFFFIATGEVRGLFILGKGAGGTKLNSQINVLAEVKNEWRYTSTPRAQCSVQH
jgi:hypothetical protein